MGDPMNVETVEDIRRALDNWEESGVPRNRALTWLAVLLDDRDRLLKAVQALRGVLVAAEEHRDDGWAAAAAAESREHQLRQALEVCADELDRWGWGDMHYGETPQEPRVVNAVAMARAALTQGPTEQ